MIIKGILVRYISVGFTPFVCFIPPCLVFEFCDCAAN